MTVNLNYLAYMLALVLMAGCTGSKKMANKAAELEQAGMYTEAANTYMESLRRNSSNVDAQIGLKNTGQRVLDDYLTAFYKASTAADHKTAVYSYRDAINYQRQVAALGVTLEIPPHYTNSYDQSKASYLSDLYQNASNHFEQEEYTMAEPIYEEILQIDSEYKDAARLKQISYMEPLYRQGQAAFQDEMYKEAYRKFGLVVATDPDYRDAANMQEKARREAAFTLTIFPFENLTSVYNIDRRVQAKIVNALTNLHDPFIEVVDRENMSAILEEQRLVLSGVVDEATATRAGEIMGVQGILFGKVIAFTGNTGRLDRRVKTAFESYSVKVLDTIKNEYQTQTRYRPVEYEEYEQDRSVTVSVQLQLISTETGKIVKSDVIEKNFRDKVSYAAYGGSVSRLYPASGENVITNRDYRNQFLQKFDARKSLRTYQEMELDVLENLSEEVAREIQAYESSRS